MNLPDFFGYEVLKYVNDNHIELPVIVISAYADMKNKLHAFNLGASDYMNKPLNLEELYARIRVHTKTNIKAISTNNDKISINKSQILVNNTPLKLTRTEFAILNLLITYKNQTLSRETFCDSIPSISSQRALDYHISNIRKKLEEIQENSNCLVSEYGFGYRLSI